MDAVLCCCRSYSTLISSTVVGPVVGWGSKRRYTVIVFFFFNKFICTDLLETSYLGFVWHNFWQEVRTSDSYHDLGNLYAVSVGLTCCAESLQYIRKFVLNHAHLTAPTRQHYLSPTQIRDLSALNCRDNFGAHVQRRIKASAFSSWCKHAAHGSASYVHGL